MVLTGAKNRSESRPRRLDPTRLLLRLPGLVVTVPVTVPIYLQRLTHRIRSILDTDGVLGSSLQTSSHHWEL